MGAGRAARHAAATASPARRALSQRGTVAVRAAILTSRPPFGGLRWWFVCPQLNRRVRKLYLPLGGRHFCGGLRWWFVCPQLNRRVRKLYLPLGGRHFWSRCAYELAYASQRETKFDRALRRARKLRLRLGGDPADDEYPDKPSRMRWATYNRLMDRLVAADGVADERLVPAARAWAIMDQGRP